MLGATAVFVLSRSISVPLRKASESARLIAAGDFTQSIDTAGRDEAAQLMQALQGMQGINDSSKKIAEIISVINASVDQATQQNAALMEQGAAVFKLLQAWSGARSGCRAGGVPVFPHKYALTTTWSRQSFRSRCRRHAGSAPRQMRCANACLLPQTPRRAERWHHWPPGGAW